MEKSSNKTIAKNTLFLYFRMALVTIVGLYTSRVILQTLGVDDFGIYNVASSAVALFSFLTGALGQSSSRYLTVELGKSDGENISALTRCFKTTMTIHLLLAVLVLVFCETIGLVILNRSAIPPERQMAAFWVFQISTLTSLFNVTQIPYTALIIAHERMSIYAYVSIFEVVAKLMICYLLVVSPIDRLVFYSILLFIVQATTLLFYRLFCRKQFAECRLGILFDKEFFKPILSFSFWNLFGSLSYTALTQGATILISFFFGPAIVTARALANQVKTHVLNFVNNFRVAINPQIIKRNAAGDKNSSNKLLFLSTSITFYMMLVFVLPLALEARFILDIWLEEVPDYTVEFMQLVMVEMLFYVYDISFYQVFIAEGRIKENAIVCPLMDIVGIIIVWLLYKVGSGVLAIAWCMIVLTALQGMVVKPWLAIHMFGHDIKDYINVFLNNAIVLVGSALIPAGLHFVLKPGTGTSLLVMFIAVLATLGSSYYIGLSQEMRLTVKSFVVSKFQRSK